MKYVLFMMFFVSPAAEPSKQVWVLQSTANMEFASQPLCAKVYGEIQGAARTTNTIQTRGWCFPTDGEIRGVAKSELLRPESTLPNNFQEFRLQSR